MMRTLLLLLAPVLVGCWPPVYTLSGAMDRELPHATRYKVIRRGDEQVRIIFWSRWGSTMTFDFAWPREAGILIDGRRVTTEDGSDPMITREKYLYR